jgi:hypothetical protein|tara:strand:+ start:783 stop:2021 length:1239 start_codon:yes stop_codon:yes gene_type:complete
METNNTVTDVNTSVEKVNLDIDSWLGAPGAESLIVPEKSEEKPNIFSGNTNTDVSFLDEEGADKADELKEVLDDIRIDVQDDENNFDSQEQSKGGRPKTEKSGLVNFLKKRIESKEMFAFDDYDESKQSLDDYLGSLNEKDVDELWQANVSNIRQEVASNTPAEFFESLPEELQYAAKYVADGGQDLKGLFQALSQVEQVREMDPTNDNDQEMIVRSYLQATNFGDADEIEEEVVNWKDLGQLEKKAKQFKPKLDMMQEEMVQSKLAQQEMVKRQQEQAAETYVQNVFEALRPGELSGVKLDKKVQSFLYNGLTSPQYPSISGNPTNLLGHLLEKYQYVEPRYDLIAEALWLLSNPDDYRSNLMRQGKNQAVEQTVRQLKTEQSRNKATSSVNTEAQDSPRKITRQTNIFKR